MAVNKRVLVTGPIFDTPSGPSGQGGKLYTALKGDGYTIYKRSNKRNRTLRLIDTLGFILINFWKYDVAIVQVFSYKAFVLESTVIIFNKLLGKKVIAVIRGGAFPEFTNKYPMYVNFILGKCSAVETPSKFIIEELKNHHIMVGYTPNFIDPTYFPYSWKHTNQPLLLWVRAFHKIYNPQIAINCVAHLKKQFPHIKLTMIGPDQGELNNMQKLIRELSVESNVDILGPQPNHDLYKFYTSHNVFLTTTSYESFGVAMVEAANCGIPMVATSVGEIPYMWENGKELLMADINNQEEFNQQVISLLTNHKLAQQLSFNAHEKVKEFTWSSVKIKWEQLIND
ncbi:MAG: glycosyltransferase family 4 protein [Bacteroidia bacterium]